MEVKAVFKQTDIGIFPNDWVIKSIKEMNVDLSDGNYSSKYPKASDFRSMGVPFIRANNIRNMTVVDEDMRYISEAQHAELLRGHLKKNDILITTRGEIGQIAFVPDRHINSNINAQLVRINIDKTGNDGRYIGYVLSFDETKKRFEDLQTGSALKQLPVGKFITLVIPLPPTKAEQKAIAEALSDADAFIEALEQLIAKKRQVKQGAMQELLTGKKRIVESGKWEVKRLGQVMKLVYGQSQKGIAAEDGDYPIIGTGGIVGRTNQHLYDKPSIIIGRKGTIDVPYYVDTPFWCIDTTFYCDVNDRANPKFLFYKFNMIDWYLYNEATGVPSLNSKTVENIEINIPLLPEQTAIAEILSDMDAEISALQGKLSKAREVKAGMMSMLLTGRIRLV